MSQQLDPFQRQGTLPLDNTGAVSPPLSMIRERLGTMLDTARQAEHLPWTGRRLEVIRIVFHQMANWLPAPERETMRAEFLAELARLGAGPFTP